MTKTTKTVRVIPFIQIEDQFQVVPLDAGGPVHPAVSRRKKGGYAIRVLTDNGRCGGETTERYDYFHLDAEGNVTDVPRGFAKDYKPGRVPVEELDAAVAKYAEAVFR